jgi:hypothetical protein
MNNNGNTEVRNNGIGFFGLLGIVFIVLKLCHVIDWPWIWVLAPIWIGFAITVVILIILFVIYKILT